MHNPIRACHWQEEGILLHTYVGNAELYLVLLPLPFFLIDCGPSLLDSGVFNVLVWSLYTVVWYASCCNSAAGAHCMKALLFHYASLHPVIASHRQQVYAACTRLESNATGE